MRVIDTPLMPRPVRRDVSIYEPVLITHELGLAALDAAIEAADAVAVDTETHDAIVRVPGGLWYRDRDRADKAQSAPDADIPEPAEAQETEPGDAATQPGDGALFDSNAFNDWDPFDGSDDEDEAPDPQGLWMAARVISVGVRIGPPRTGEYSTWVIDLRDLDPAAVANTMAKIKVAEGWNADFDEEVLEIYGAPVPKWRDGKISDSLLWAGTPGRSWYLSLAEAARRYLDIEIDGKGTTQTSYDESTTLTDEQVRYAGHDALLPLWLAEEFDDLIDAAGLTLAAELEHGQRPFLRAMMRDGFPFAVDRWSALLDEKQRAFDEVNRKLASLTGADGSPKANFNPGSDVELRAAFNTYETELVKSFFGGRLFSEHDKVDASQMKALRNEGSQIAATILELRKIAKYLTTYGAEFIKYCVNGRIRPRYKQTLTSTGRLASDRPNGQNAPQEAKEYIEAPPGWVLIDSDYSQAELRALADMAEEPAMLEAFFAGLDLHDETARQVFDIVLSELKKSDPNEAKKIRTKVKGVNFGIPYGMQAAALALRLSNEGVPTTIDEARELINKIMASRPKMAAWLNERDEFVKAFSMNPGPVDWDASFKLLKLWQEYESPRRAFKKKNKRYPSAAELVDITTPAQLSLFEPPMTDEERLAKIADVDWAFRYDAPVVLRPGVAEADGKTYYDPIAFESRTNSGRRRLFMVVMDSGYQRSEDDDKTGSKKADQFSGLVTSAALTVATTDKVAAAQIRDNWARANNVDLPFGVNRCVQQPGESRRDFRTRERKFKNEERTKVVNAFKGKNRQLKTAFVEHVCATMGPEASSFLLSKALTDCIGALGPAFRNHPIQGGVADIAAAAYAELHALCDEYPELIWVQTVHDSIIGQAPEAQGHEIAVRKKAIMESAMNRFYPGVPAKVDTEIRRHLGDGGTIEVLPDSEIYAPMRRAA